MQKLIVSSSPHLNSGVTTQTIMRDVLIALTPAAIASIIFFGLNAAILIVACTGSAILTEYVCRRVMKRKQTIMDLSAAVTGLLLALNLPSTISPFIGIFGSVIAIVVIKQMFGGIGQNFVNPALGARIILLNSYPAKMTDWVYPFDGITSSTPLDALSSATSVADLPTYFDLFIGNVSGSLGETSALAILLGGAYLIYKKVISPVIPVTFIGTVFVLSFIIGRDPIYDILAGGLMLGAFFMATDYTTSPIHTKARIIFAIGCGLITILIREYAYLPEGVSYAILVMNITVPLIERVCKITPFGIEKRRKNA